MKKKTVVVILILGGILIAFSLLMWNLKPQEYHVDSLDLARIRILTLIWNIVTPFISVGISLTLILAFFDKFQIIRNLVISYLGNQVEFIGILIELVAIGILMVILSITINSVLNFIPMANFPWKTIDVSELKLE